MSKAFNEIADSIFQRVAMFKEVGGRKIKRFPAGMLPSGEIKDGDGDGVIFDGSPEERPVIIRRNPMPPAGVARPAKKRIAPPSQQSPEQAVPQPPQASKPPEPKRIAPTKPSPMQAMREAKGTKPLKETHPKQKSAGKQPGMRHAETPLSPKQVPLSEDNIYSIKKSAESMTPKEASEMASRYENLADEVWNTVSISREEAKRRGANSRMDDSEKARLKKAKEFDSKAALWAYFAENPDAVKEPHDYTPPEDAPFDELVELKTSTATIGSTGPQSWDDIDSYAQDRVMQDWVENRMREDDFLEWAADSIRENIDAEEVIRENVDDLLEMTTWDDLDVGQRELSDQIESTIKQEIEKGVQVGPEMSQEHALMLAGAIGESSQDWRNGDLDSDTRQAILDLTMQALRKSEPGEVNLPNEDEIAEILAIEEEDAVSQIYEIWRRGRGSIASEVEKLIDSELESQMDSDDILRPMAESEWENLDSEESFAAAASLGYAEDNGYDGDGASTSSTLRSLGIDDAASFVGAPDGTYVQVEGDTISVTGPGGFEMNRTINGDMTIHADLFKIGEDYKGQATEILSQMVAQARAAGFTEIETMAAGELGDYYNGYYTWPCMGYDQKIRGLSQEDEIRRLFPGVESIQDLFERPSGRDWWLVNGSVLRNAKFDLSDGSRSMQVMERYLNEKLRKS